MLKFSLRGLFVVVTLACLTAFFVTPRTVEVNVDDNQRMLFLFPIKDCKYQLRTLDGIDIGSCNVVSVDADKKTAVIRIPRWKSWSIQATASYTLLW